MNILGVGTPEVIIIALILLVVAGPHRMVRWAYLAGRYMARLREMWAEAASTLQEELEATGLKDELRDLRKAGDFNVVEEVRRTIAEPAGIRTRKHEAREKEKEEREARSWTPEAGQPAKNNEDQEPTPENHVPSGG